MNDELKKIWNSFITSVANNKNLKDLYVKLDSGVAAYQEAQEFTSSLSNYLVSWLAKEYPSDSQKVLDALKDTNICKNFFAKADEYTYSVQKSINESLGIGLNASKPALKTTLIDKDTIATGNYDYDLNKYANAVELSVNKRVDTIQQENARFQSDAGFGVTVSRKYDGRGLSDGRTCKWCLERVGSNISYKQAVSRGMFQRHEGCHCMIEYNNNGAKTRQYSIGGKRSWYQANEFDKRYSLKYNNTPTKELRAMWARGVDEGWISSLVSFDTYSNAYNTLEKELVGERTKDGIAIREISEHFMQRLCGTSRDPKIYEEQLIIVRRSGTEPEDVIDALLNGESRPTAYDANGNPSKLYVGSKCKVSINPDTGKLIQCNLI